MKILNQQALPCDTQRYVLIPVETAYHAVCVKSVSVLVAGLEMIAVQVHRYIIIICDLCMLC